MLSMADDSKLGIRVEQIKIVARSSSVSVPLLGADVSARLTLSRKAFEWLQASMKRLEEGGIAMITLEEAKEILRAGGFTIE